MATLLTGATGFLGIHLLSEFLRQDQSVVALVRPRNGESNLDRIRRLLAMAGAQDVVQRRVSTHVRCLTGDLRAPLLGLTVDEIPAALEDVDDVWHCAASINLRPDSPEPWEANVEGTARVLDLIELAPRQVRFFPISTVYVAGTMRRGRFEEEFPATTTSFENIYERSKDHAEKLILDWCERTGRSCTVFRTSTLITDRSIIGDFPGHTLLAVGRLLSALVGAAPDGTIARLRWPADPLATINMVPVEYAAELMVRVAAAIPSGSPPQAIHITNPVETSIHDMRTALEETCDVRIRAVPDIPSDPARAERQLYRMIGPFLPYFNQRRTYGSDSGPRAQLNLPACPLVDRPFMIRSLSALRAAGASETRAESVSISSATFDGGSAVDTPMLHQLFEDSARRWPQRTALICGPQKITYDELKDLSTRLAGRLSKHGAGPGEVVAACIPTSTWALVAQLAVLKSGAAYLPLDPQTPPARMVRLLDTTKPVLVLRVGDQEPLETTYRVITIDQPEEATEPPRAVDFGPLPPASSSAPTDLAYVLFTSGSTGMPKGVMVEHHAIVRSTLARRTVYRKQPEHVLLVSPLFFDMSMGSVWWAWSSGAALEVVEGGAAQVFQAFEQAFVQGSTVTHVICTPSLYGEILGGLRTAAASPAVVALGGEVVPQALIRRHFAIAPDTRLFNEYGPTEAAVWCTVAELRLSDADDAAASVGTPIPGTDIVLLSSEGNPIASVDTVTAGEVCIAGNLARGYLARPDLTAQRFISHPIDASRRMYRTGDLGRWGTGGELRIVGRMDDQVKIRGHRVEPGETEAVLRAHPDVSDAAVIAIGAGTHTRLAAFVTPANVSPDSVDMYLRARLPDYLLPQTLAVLAALPRTERGKLDRRALAQTLAPAPAPIDAADTRVDDMATTIEHAWRDILGLTSVDRDADFFDSGGDSLLALALRNRLQHDLDDRVGLPAGVVFQAPSVRSLAALISNLASPAADSLDVSEHVGQLELSGPQTLWWYINHYRGPGVISAPTYALTVHHLIDGALDVDALDRAICTVVRRHEPLRTRVDLRGDGGHQEVLAPGAQILYRFDVPSASDTAHALEAAVAEVERLPFGIDIGQHIVAGVIQYAPARYLLVVRVNHMVGDDWSMRLIEQEISHHYQQELAGSADGPAALPVKYTDFAVWQHRTFLSDRAWRDRPLYRDTLDYWRRYTAGLRPTHLPGLDGPTDHAKVTLKTTLDADTCQRIRDIAKGAGTTPYAVMATVFSWLLQEETGDDDVALLATHHFRHAADLYPLVGLFFEPVLVRSSYTKEMSFPDRLKETASVISRTMAHLDVPMFALCEEIRDLSTYMLSPFVCFELIPEQKGLVLPGAVVTRKELFTPDYEVSDFVCPSLIMMTAREDADVMRLCLAYDRDVATDSRMRELFDHYLSLLRRAVSLPEPAVALQGDSGDFR